MNPRISITNLDEFDDVVNNLNSILNRIRDLFDEENKTMDTILNNPRAWSGKARDAADDKYKQFSQVYPSVTQSLENFVRFLGTTASNYRAFEMSVNKNIDNLSDNLNVN